MSYLMAEPTVASTMNRPFGDHKTVLDVLGSNRPMRMGRVSNTASEKGFYDDEYLRSSLKSPFFGSR